MQSPFVCDNVSAVRLTFFHRQGMHWPTGTESAFLFSLATVRPKIAGGKALGVRCEDKVGGHFGAPSRLLARDG